MAICVCKNSDGTLVSYCQNDGDPVADAATLAAKGLIAITGQPQIGPTTVWDAATKSVKTIAAPKSIISVPVFWKRFTTVEREAIEGMALTGTAAVKNAIAAFFRYVQSAGSVDCNDAYIVAKVTQLETIGVLAAGRAAQILV